MLRTATPPKESRAVVAGREAHVNVVVLANRILGEMEAICQTEDISHQQYIALWNLCLAEDTGPGLSVGSVADGLLTRAADVTRLIDRLEAAGLVERMRNPDDRRGVLVRATADAHRVFGSVTPALQTYHSRQWSALTREELDEFRRLLTKVLWGLP
ncbi:MAG: MarR family transcriptional regulator [Acidimicrobiales bacterium]|jgi:DNA-binding MarR family transcriptional regulator